ncbi:MAG: DUF2784 domain-containing protein [Nitriliruptorales bacterium]
MEQAVPFPSGGFVLYHWLADLTVVVHFAFIAFIALGGFLSWRWPRLVWLHIPAVTWGVAIITIGFTCPLTPLEKYFRGLAGGEGYEGGFVDRYLEDVIYPDELTHLLRLLAGMSVLAAYFGLAVRRQRSRGLGRLGHDPAEYAVRSSPG